MDFSSGVFCGLSSKEITFDIIFSTLFLAFLVPVRLFGFLADDDFLVGRLFVVLLLVLVGFLFCVFLVVLLAFLVDRLVLVVFLLDKILVERLVFAFFVDVLRLLIGFLVFFLVLRFETATKKSTYYLIKNSQITCF